MDPDNGIASKNKPTITHPIQSTLTNEEEPQRKNNTAHNLIKEYSCLNISRLYCFHSSANVSTLYTLTFIVVPKQKEVTIYHLWYLDDVSLTGDWSRTSKGEQFLLGRDGNMHVRWNVTLLAELNGRTSMYGTVKVHVLLSLVPRLFCVGREKRAWYTQSAHAPNIQQLFIQTWRKILIITVIT